MNDEMDRFRDYILEHWGNTVIAQGKRIMMIDDRLKRLEQKEYSMTEHLKILLQKTEGLLKNCYHLYSEFYYADDIKEIQNGLSLILKAQEK